MRAVLSGCTIEHVGGPETLFSCGAQRIRITTVATPWTGRVGSGRARVALDRCPCAVFGVDAAVSAGAHGPDGCARATPSGGFAALPNRQAAAVFLVREGFARRRFPQKTFAHFCGSFSPDFRDLRRQHRNRDDGGQDALHVSHVRASRRRMCGRSAMARGRGHATRDGVQQGRWRSGGST